MERLTWLMRFALAACCTLALSCGGDGNTDDDDGGTNDDDTGDQNPLIEKIPGTWTLDRDADGPVEHNVAHDRDVTVDPMDPDCSDLFSTTPEVQLLHDPGDACVRWGPPLVLDGNALRIHFVSPDGSWSKTDGEVTDDGQRMIVTYTEGLSPTDSSTPRYREYVKIE